VSHWGLAVMQLANGIYQVKHDINDFCFFQSSHRPVFLLLNKIVQMTSWTELEQEQDDLHPTVLQMVFLM
jgi:hypothetical protein